MSATIAIRRWRGGRAAEGDGLLNRYTGYHSVSRVRIPPSPFSFRAPVRLLASSRFSREKRTSSARRKNRFAVVLFSFHIAPGGINSHRFVPQLLRLLLRANRLFPWLELAKQRVDAITPATLPTPPLQRIVRGAAILDHPPGKLLDGLQVEIKRMGADAAFMLHLLARDRIELGLVFFQVGQIVHHRAGTQVRPGIEAASLDDPLEPSTHQIDMTCGGTMSRQCGTEIMEMFSNRTATLQGQALGGNTTTASYAGVSQWASNVAAGVPGAGGGGLQGYNIGSGLNLSTIYNIGQPASASGGFTNNLYDSVDWLGRQAQALDQRYAISTRAGGLAMMAGGGLEIGGGVAVATGGTAGTGGLAAPAAIGGGYLIAAHGTDNLTTGWHQLWTGQPTITRTSQLLQSTGLSPAWAQSSDAAISIVGMNASNVVKMMPTRTAGTVAASKGAPASTPVGRLGQPMNVPRGTNPGTTIGGRNFDGHAIDQMQGRGVVPSAVENTIHTGTRSLDPRPGRFRYYDSVNNLTVVTES